jgi:hypothetical protein
MRLTLYTILFVAFSSGAIAENYGDLGYGARKPFFEHDNNAPQSYRRISDPTGMSPTRKVHEFRIGPGFCSNNQYKNSQNSDCAYNSVRSELVEDVWEKDRLVQPPAAWYGFSTFFPRDFSETQQRARGSYIFAQWHNGQCPHLSFWSGADPRGRRGLFLITQEVVSGYDCRITSYDLIANFDQLKGSWTNFEVYVKWSEGSDGRAVIYRDGRPVVDRRGRTLTRNVDQLNRFSFGIYLCCTRGTNLIEPTRVLFSNIQRGKSRESLAVGR